MMHRRKFYGVMVSLWVLIEVWLHGVCVYRSSENGTFRSSVFRCMQLSSQREKKGERAGRKIGNKRGRKEEKKEGWKGGRERQILSITVYYNPAELNERKRERKRSESARKQILNPKLCLLKYLGLKGPVGCSLLGHASKNGWMNDNKEIISINYRWVYGCSLNHTFSFSICLKGFINKIRE